MRDYHELVETVKLTHADTSAQVHVACSGGFHFRVKTIQLSVFKAAQGDDGILEILNTDGDWLWTVNVDTVKDETFSFGIKGMDAGQNVGIQAVLSGGQTQASVSLCVIAHLSTD